MRIRDFGAALLALAVIGTAALAQSSRPTSKPEWAYAIPVPGQPALPRLHQDGVLYSVPGSKQRFTRNKVGGLSDDGRRTRVQPADWFPNEHPRMPKIVAEGDPKRGIVACSLCHSANGRGRPQNAHLAGLPDTYFVRQMRDMKRAWRQSAEPRKKNAHEMVEFAKAMTEREIREAALYYAAIPWGNFIRVVETDMVPKTVSADGMMLPLAGNGREKLGRRIIETPADPKRTDLRDPHSGYIAYVPKGAVAQGRRLVSGGGGRTMACANCHGRNLGGVGDIPGIAGRSPSYMARQLYDMQRGARRGPMASLMRPAVTRLSAEDIIAITAYAASLPVPRR